MIKVINLTKKYNNEIVLDRLNFTLPNKGLIVIYGPSGCGKTTLFNCLSGLLKFSGDITIDDKYINQLSLDELCKFRLKNIGFIFQDFKLFENETVENNVLLPLHIISDEEKETKTRKCDELLKRMKMIKKNLKNYLKK